MEATIIHVALGPNCHVSWFLDFPSRALEEALGIFLLIPTERLSVSEELLHGRVPGTISSSMSSMSSDMMKCWGVALPPMKVGSRLRAEASDGRPGLLTMVKPVRISICCQRCSLSRRAAVTSPRACLQKIRRKYLKENFAKRRMYEMYVWNHLSSAFIF